jgi:hypothetical protein
MYKYVRVFITSKGMPFLANSFTSMECLSNRFDMAKLIEATIIKASNYIHQLFQQMAVSGHEIILKYTIVITDWQL